MLPLQNMFWLRLYFNMNSILCLHLIFYIKPVILCMLSYTGTWHPVGDNSESPPKSEGGPPKGPKGDNDKGEFADNGPPKLVLGLSESGPEWEFILLC